MRNSAKHSIAVALLLVGCLNLLASIGVSVLVSPAKLLGLPRVQRKSQPSDHGAVGGRANTVCRPGSHRINYGCIQAIELRHCRKRFILWAIGNAYEGVNLMAILDGDLSDRFKTIKRNIIAGTIIGLRCCQKAIGEAVICRIWSPSELPVKLRLIAEIKRKEQRRGYDLAILGSIGDSLRRFSRIHSPMDRTEVVSAAGFQFLPNQSIDCICNCCTSG